MNNQRLAKLEKMAPPPRPPAPLFDERELRLLSSNERKELISILEDFCEASERSAAEFYARSEIREARRRIAAREDYFIEWLRRGKYVQSSLRVVWSLEEDLKIILARE